MDGHETLEDNWTARTSFERVPGVVVVYSARCPLLRVVPLEGGKLTLGRMSELGAPAPDGRMSREHAQMSFDGREWTIRDLGSHNGTFVDGVRLTGEARFASPHCVRMGQTIVLPRANVLPFMKAPPLVQDGLVVGPTLRRALDAIAHHAVRGENVLCVGESGAGKELAAKTFHASSPNQRGPFVPVNCAAIPQGVAERLLFGAKRGAYSGADADSIGYVQSAHNGVLFLDEFGELDLEVQAKLLRALETKEILPLGAARGVRVDVLFCFATHRELRAAVAKGAFRADLLYRISQAEVVVPPLRERAEEIPWLISLELERSAPEILISAEIVEACILRHWPGNVRELLGEIRKAAKAARDNGAHSLRSEYLPEHAGKVVVGQAEAREPEGAAVVGISRAELERALSGASTAAEAAQRLGVHRSHLYRLLKRYGIPRSRGE
jgi:transcriptional regulator with GAF, ATPase, and Fis domain